MCKYVFLTGDKCVRILDANGPRFITKDEGFFDHGVWTIQPTPACRATHGFGHCSLPDRKPKWKDVAVWGGPYIEFDMQPHRWRAPNDELIMDYRCKRCRDRENYRAV